MASEDCEYEVVHRVKRPRPLDPNDCCKRCKLPMSEHGTVVQHSRDSYGYACPDELIDEQ